MGLPVMVIPLHAVKPWRLWRLQRFVRRERPRIALSWAPHAAVYAHWLHGVGPLRRIVNVRGDLTVDSDSGAATTDVYRYLHALVKADLMVGNSRWSLQVLQRLSPKLPPTMVIYNIMPPGAAALSGEPVEVPRIAAVGCLKPLKAYDVLLHALGLLAAQGQKFQLLLAGGGPERANLQALAERLGLAERVQFLGDVSDVRPWLATAHLFVHPSKSESLSNAILEAMAEGLPVVASSVGGNPEIVADGQTGLLVPPGRSDLLADAVRRLLCNPGLRGRLGAQGLDTVRRRFGAPQAVEQYENAFRRLLADHDGTL
jgi:glycosyltransferase involved in cell wall biosynthesis